MFIEIDLNKPVPIFNQIMDGVRLAVATGRIVPGDRIPSIRDLAVELRVNPNTVAKAYQELERSGLVEVKRGMGYFVSESDNGQVSQRERHTLFEKLADDLIASGIALGLDAEELRRLIEKRLERLEEGS
ncbi:MAG: GntR family transcriptional regulator [Candidatus Omnitrophica bacterium]|nr:GntR family transcriptional regulator [Candidatus Omnitrophota bacterium]